MDPKIIQVFYRAQEKLKGSFSLLGIINKNLESLVNKYNCCLGLCFGTDGKLYTATCLFLSSISLSCSNSIERFEIFLSKANRSSNSIMENL